MNHQRRYQAERNRVTPSVRARVFERDRFTCRRCGCKAPFVEIVIDHIVPVSRGGDSHLGNLQTLCNTCNAGKSDREPSFQDKYPYHCPTWPEDEIEWIPDWVEPHTLLERTPPMPRDLPPSAADGWSVTPELMEALP